MALHEPEKQAQTFPFIIKGQYSMWNVIYICNVIDL